MSDFFHAQVFDALVREATSAQRWLSRGHLADELGVTPSTLSMATSGSRAWPASRVDELERVTGWSRDLLWLPQVSRPGDLESARLLTEVRRLREQVSDVLLRGTDEVAQAIRERNGG